MRSAGNDKVTGNFAELSYLNAVVNYDIEFFAHTDPIIMKLAILHQDLEWGEQTLSTLLNQWGYETRLINIIDAQQTDFSQFDIVLNRVYASVANRNLKDTALTLDILQQLETAGIRCINTYNSSRCDYDKYLQYKVMDEHGIPTPSTASINNNDELEAYLCNSTGTQGYPVVVKRRTGGRAVGIFKANSAQELSNYLHKHLNDKSEGNYSAGYLVQTYLKSVRPYDIRIAIIAGKFAYSYSRSLVASNLNETPWIGSGELGSKVTKYEPTKAEISLALKASKATGALINEVDLLATENGLFVIENNLTPNFIPS